MAKKKFGALSACSCFGALYSNLGNVDAFNDLLASSCQGAAEPASACSACYEKMMSCAGQNGCFSSDDLSQCQSACCS